MSYFSPDELSALRQPTTTRPDTISTLRHKMQILHERTVANMRVHNVPLLCHHHNGVTTRSISDHDTPHTLAIQYGRNSAQSLQIERLMGSDAGATSHIDIARHPAIEIRLTPDHLAVELIASPEAWWDQQNLVGKLTLPQHRREFCDMLVNLGEAYRQGFWRGPQLSDMHLVLEAHRYPRIFEAWFSTFEPRQDWFRVGIWHRHGIPPLDDETALVDTLIQHIKALHPIYDYIAWSGNNDFRRFYQA